MKKLALTIICALATTGAFAQGWVSWSTPNASITGQTNSTVYSPLFGGGATSGGAIGNTANNAATGLIYDYELLYQPWSGSITTDTHVWDGTWKDTGLGATNTFNGRLSASGSSGNIDLSGTIGWSNPTTNNLVLVGWSATLGTSWAVVSNECVLAAANPNHYFTVAGNQQNNPLCFFGESSFGYIKPASATPGNTAFGLGTFGATGLPIFSLNTQLYEVPIPEPATFAMVGLGGLSLLLFRRRK
jgi:PEP-CTERM motif